MVSLPAIESVLSRKWKSNDWTESLAIESEEDWNWNVKFTLFTTENLEKTEINNYLHEQWIRNLVSIDEIIQLKEIPVLGTWKVDYVQLKSILSQKETNTPTKSPKKVSIKKK